MANNTITRSNAFENGTDDDDDDDNCSEVNVKREYRGGERNVYDGGTSGIQTRVLRLDFGHILRLR